MKKALIFGITGQDGSYLAEVLLEKGYEVHGMYRRSATGNFKNIQHLVDENKITLHKGDLADPTSIYRIITTVMPDEIYNEADQDHVGWSHAVVGYNCDVTAAAVGRILETIKQVNPKIKYFQPCSSTMFDHSKAPQTEETKFDPQSPYAVGKVSAYYLVNFYRKTHGLFATTGIFYNHDSPRRSEEYLLHKICASAVRISKGLQKELKVGSFDMPVDIGYSREFMEGVHKLMQLDEPGDYIISSGTTYTIGELIAFAFKACGISTEGKLGIDERFAPKGPVPLQVGDISKLKAAIGFAPEYHGEKLVKLLVESAILEIEEEELLKQARAKQ